MKQLCRKCALSWNGISCDCIVTKCNHCIEIRSHWLVRILWFHWSPGYYPLSLNPRIDTCFKVIFFFFHQQWSETSSFELILIIALSAGQCPILSCLHSPISPTCSAVQNHVFMYCYRYLWLLSIINNYWQWEYYMKHFVRMNL